MKILFFTDSLGGGGKERRMGELIKGLIKKGGYEIEIATMDKKIEYSIFKDLKIPIHFLIRTIAWDPTIFWKLYRLCKTFKPDIVHTWDPMTSLYASPITKILGIIFVNGMITIAPSNVKKLNIKWLFIKINMLFSNIILSNSAAGLKSFQAPSSKSAVVQNGFDFQRIENIKNPDKVKHDLSFDKFKVIGMVASFTIHKDYHTFLNAARIIVKKRPDVAFVAIGDGPFLEKHRKSLTPSEADRIKLIGRIHDVESYINIFDIGILLTNNKVVGEGISNSIMEYMALAKPVIATDSGGTKEIVVDKQTGFLVGHEDIDNLISKIEFLLDDPGIALTMGNLGRDRITKEYSLDDMINKFIDIYTIQMMKNKKYFINVKGAKILYISEMLYAPFDEGIKTFSRSILASLVSLKGSDIRAITTHGTDIVSLNLHRYKINKFLLSFKLRKRVKLKSPQIIIYIPGSSLTPVSLFRTLILHYYLSSAKMVVVGLQPRVLNSISRFILEYFLKNVLFLVQSDLTREYLKEAGGRVRLLPSGVDLTKFRPVSIERKYELREKYHLEKSRYLILHVGHINVDRNIQALIDIQQDMDNQIIVVGSTSTTQNESVLDLLESNQVIVYKDYIAEIEELYQIADCFVFPVYSKTNAIEFPLSVLEAMACNLPIIATRFSGLTTFIRESDSFRYINNDQEIRTSLDYIKKSKNINNRAVAEHFSWNEITLNMLKQIDDAFKV